MKTQKKHVVYMDLLLTCFFPLYRLPTVISGLLKDGQYINLGLARYQRSSLLRYNLESPSCIKAMAKMKW